MKRKGKTMKQTAMKMTMGLGIMMLAAQQLQAQPANCAPRQTVLERLAGVYGETRRGMGLIREKAMMEVFASEDTGSWTIVMTLPNGTTCLMASGQSFETVAENRPPNT